MASSYYATDLEARVKGRDNNQTVNASVVSLPYSNIADSGIIVSNSEILKYAKQYSNKYKQDASRDIEYIKLEVSPSVEDSTRMLEWAAEIAEKFETTNNDSLFVSSMGSETMFDPRYKSRGSFSPQIENRIFDNEKEKLLALSNKMVCTVF